MEVLTKIANKYGTDKGTEFREKHAYTEFYQRYFEKYQKRHVRILEIGVEAGGSLKMYDDFFHGDCEIHAIDIAEYTKTFENYNTHIHIADQDSYVDINKFKSEMVNNGMKFDIIIDDGSHNEKHQITNLYWLNELLSEDGIYIIEDLHPHANDTNLSTNPIGLLCFNKHSDYLTESENKELIDKIKTVEILINDDSECERHGSGSITSIIQFKK